jgi:hypothetical protein
MKTCPRCGKETDQPFHTCKKMNTPQEEAEEIAKKCALAIWGGTPTSETGREIVSNDQLAILNTIPLAELIAVARAASKSQIIAAIFNDEDVELQDALQALRATGKAEL